MSDVDLKEFANRVEALKADPHIKEQVERLLPVLALVNGTKDVRSLESYIENVAVGVARLELMPDLDFSNIYGGIAVARGPMQGYGLLVWSADVFAMHLDHGNGTGSFEGLDHWNNAQQHRFEKEQA